MTTQQKTIENPLRFEDVYGNEIIKIIIAKDLRSLDLKTGYEKQLFRQYLAGKYVKTISDLRRYIKVEGK